MNKKNYKTALGHFLDLISSEKKELAVIITYEIAIGILSLIIPIGVQTVVNTIAFTQLFQPVVFLGFALLIGQVIGIILKTIQVVIVEKLQQRIFALIGLELAYRIPRIQRILKIRYHELVNRFFDVVTIQKSISSLFVEGIALVLQTIIGLTLLAFYHPVLIIFDAILIIAIFFILFVLGRGAIKSSIKESKEKYKYVDWLEEIAEKNIAFGSVPARNFAFEKANQSMLNYLDARQSHFVIVLRQFVGFLSLQAIANTSLLVMGVWLISKNQLSIGQLVAAEIVVSTVLYSLSRIRKHLDSFYDLCAALDKVSFLLELPIEKSGNISLDDNDSMEVEFKSVLYKFKDDLSYLGPISFKVTKSHNKAIHGSNGSGKSTIIDLIYGLKKHSSGAILLNGVDIREIDLESLRQKVFLLRGIELIQGSILKNIQLGNPDVKIEKINDALKRVGLFDEIMSLPKGIQTTISPTGTPLSVSQAKKLMLARMLVQKPALVLIDETLDALDEDSKELAMQVIFSKDSNWTTIVTSTHIEVEDRCDSILNLDHLGEQNGI